MGSSNSKPKNQILPPEEKGLPFLGNAIQFAKSPIGFTQKTTHELGNIWRSVIAGNQSVFLVGNEAVNEMLKEENISRAEPIEYMVQILAGGEKRITPFLDGEIHLQRRQMIFKMLTDEAVDQYLPVLEEIFDSTFPSLLNHDTCSMFKVACHMQALFIMRIVAGLPKDYVDQHADQISKYFDDIADGLQSKFPVNIPHTAFGRAIHSENAWISILEDSIEEHERIFRNVGDLSKMPQNFISHMVVNNSALTLHDQLSNHILAREMHHLTIANYGIASLLTYSMLALTSHGNVKDKLIEEVDSKIGKRRNILMKELKDLDYMDQVIKETLRFYPIVPIITGKAKRDFQVEGFTVKKGWSCMGVVFTTNRDPKVYTRPNTFDPERFNKSRAEDQHAKCPLAAYIPQGGGETSNSHRCVGEMFSRYICKYYLSRILQEYNWTLIAEQNVKIDFSKFAPLPFDGLLLNFINR